MGLLDVEGLMAYYDKAVILHGVDIHVDRGEYVAVLGPNGAGKTTLLKSIIGLVRTEGSIRFNGVDLSSYSPYERIRLGISISPEGRRLFPNMTVEDNLILGSLDGDYRDRLEFIYSLFPEIKRRRNSLAKMLSGGEQQMVAIGRALMSNPKLLLMDEPSMGLAPIVLSRIRDVLEEIRGGVSILLVEQNIKLAFDIVDRVYILVKGRVVDEGSVDSFRGLERRYFEII